MDSHFFKLCKKFKLKTGEIVTVVEVDGIKYFENENGDLLGYIEDDLVLHVIQE